MNTKLFGNKLCDLMKEKNVNNVELHKKTGIGLASIIRLKKGLSVPQAKTLYKICNALGVTPKELLKE